jgi:hypothetical protein
MAVGQVLDGDEVGFSGNGHVSDQRPATVLPLIGTALSALRATGG